MNIKFDSLRKSPIVIFPWQVKSREQIQQLVQTCSIGFLNTSALIWAFEKIWRRKRCSTENLVMSILKAFAHFGGTFSRVKCKTLTSVTSGKIQLLRGTVLKAQ